MSDIVGAEGYSRPLRLAILRPSRRITAGSLSRTGQTGQSFNIYERVSGKWRQTWVDSTGGLHEYSGGLVDGNMTYEGDIPAPPGQKGRVHTRLTFFKRPDGTVRQVSERTTDGGKSWAVNYDLVYTKRK